ncbi:MAG TPA: hypothetical protein VM536_02290, partial [Chloroflexia bacterium]|nr:hypothetical protein [Chloroflexia bacterium]
ETGGLKNTGGGQDQFAAAFGGLQGLRFAGGHVTRRALRLAPATLAALNGGLLLCYSGTAHVSGALLAELVRRYQAGDPATLAHLRRLRELAGQVEAVLEGAALGRLGPLLTANWQAFRSFHPTIATPAIDTIFRVARAAGATGGKATGAGGGGCVLLASELTDRERVAGALQAAGFLLIPFQFVGEGVTVVDAPPLAPP